MAIKKKLESVLNKKKLPAKIRKNWQGNFDFLSAEQKILLLEIFRNSTKKEILEISLLMDKKIEAIISGDKKQWGLILKSESDI